MTDTEAFLNSYKRLESVLSRSNLTPLAYENILPEHSEDQDKLKTCRIIRNYLSHHPDSAKMFPATKDMTEFVEELAEKEEQKYTTLKDLSVKTMIATPQTTLKDLVDEFARISKKRDVKCDGCELTIPYLAMDDSKQMVYVIPERFIFISLASGETMRHKVDEKLLKQLSCPYELKESHLFEEALNNLSGSFVIVKSLTAQSSARNFVGMIWR